MDSPKAGRSDGICDDVIARHSDYLDGLLPAHEAAQVQWHLSTCSSCARYDRVVRRGLEMVRELPEVLPSEDFAERLQHRIYHLQDGRAIANQRTAGAAATFAVASMIALLAWSPLILGGAGPAPGMQATAAPPRPEPAVLPPPRLLDGEDVWFPLPAQPLGTSDLIATLAAFPGPYSPLVVQPPVHGGGVRTVSSEFAPID